MYKKYEEYINTAQSGLIVLVEHNLDTLRPDVTIYEPVDLSDLKIVPNYDPRIVSIESKGTNVTQVTFSSAFEGYISLTNVKNSRNTVEDRLSNVESLLDQLIIQQKQFVAMFQWKQMNNYFENKVVELEQQVKGIGSEVDVLKIELDNL